MSEPDLDFDYKLMQKIRGLFRKGGIITSNILYAFHDYDVNILGEQDIQHVKAEINNHGEIEGSFLLLQKLLSYKNWFSCLLEVLRDSQVKQDHVADEIENIYEDLTGHKFDELDNMTTSYRDPYARQKSTGDLDMMNYEKEIQQDLNLDTCDFAIARFKHGPNHSCDDLQLIDKTWEIVGAPMNAGDTVVGHEGEESDSDDCESFVVLGKGTIPADFQPPLVQEENGRCVVQSKLQRSTTSDYVSATESVKDETFVKEIHNNFCKLDEYVEATQEVPEKNQQETQVKEPANHGPEYDFDPEMVEKELGDLDGWHPNISEKEIIQKMNPLLSEDGHYLLFYWPKRKRPAMSVTFNKSFVTFTVHKRPRDEDKNNAEFFYIYKSEKKASNLANIVKYHLEHGICYTSENGEKEKVSFDHPVPLH